MSIKSVVANIVIALLFTGIILSTLNFSTAANGTQVSGILWDNTTWTLANSPYIITDTIQVPSNVTLTIEPGVTVTTSMTTYDSKFLFLMNGNISACGIANSMIIIDGKGCNFFSTTGSSGSSFLDLKYCRVQNGSQFWQPQDGSNGYAHFNLTYSTISDFRYSSLVWYPTQDVYIEHNVFVNYAGFSTWHSVEHPGNVYIRYNLFYGSSASPFVVENWSFGSNKTFVEYNSFIDIDGVVLSLKEGYPDTGINGTNNYWGTTNTASIGLKIHDKNTDITCADIIAYQPFLSSPDTLTPICINASAGTGGKITPNGTVRLNQGDNQSFTISTDNGYHVVAVLVNGTSVGILTTYNIENVTGITTISVTFAVDPTPTPTATASSSGSSSSSSSSSSSHSSDSPTPTATPTAPEFTPFAIAALIVAATLTLLYCKKKCNPSIVSSFSFSS
jgi:hypothetical protein